MLRRLSDPADQSVTYLLLDALSREAAVVDASLAQATLVLSILAERATALRYVLRTHSHAEDRAKLPCGSLCSRTGARLVTADPRPGDIAASDGLRLPFGRGEIQVIATPGHTPDSVCYLWGDRLFCGDTLLIGGAAAPTAQTDPGALHDSVTQRLFVLDAETLVYPGHDQQGRTVSSIGEERATNGAFTASRAVFVARCKRDSPGTNGQGLLSHVSGRW